MAFAPDYARSGRFYVYFTDRDGNQQRAGVPPLQRAARTAPTSRSRRQVHVDGRPVSEPQRRACCCSGPDELLYIGTGDGGSGGDPENRAQNLDSLLGKILRIDPRAARLERLPLARVEPVRGPRRAQRDLRLRAAQPVALLVRPPHRRPLHRRRGPEHRRGDRLRAPRGRRAGATTAGAASRAGAASTTRAAARSAVGPVLDVRALRRGVLGHGRRRRARPAVPDLAGRYVYGDYCAGRLRSFRIAGGKATGRPRRSACASRSSARSARTPAAASTRRRSTGPVYRLRSGG